MSSPDFSPKKRAFLAAYAECGNVTHAAELAGVSRRSHVDWMKDPAYVEAFRAAEDQAADKLEKEARRRAIEGLERIKFGRNGEPLVNPHTGQPYTAREYSDTLLIFLLKGIRPEKYRENVRQEITGKDGSPLGVIILPAVSIPAASEVIRKAE